MRYLDKLLGEANNFKKIRFAVDKAREAESRADKEQGKYLDRLTSKKKFSTDDKKQSDTLDRMRDAEKVEDRAIKMANKLVPRVHKKGGGKGDGKPRGKLRLVQSAFYQQVGHLIAEIGDAAELDMSSAEKTVERGDRWYKWLKKNMRTAPRRKVSKAEAKLRTAGKNADKALSKASKSIARRDDFLSGGGQKLV